MNAYNLWSLSKYINTAYDTLQTKVLNMYNLDCDKGRLRSTSAINPGCFFHHSYYKNKEKQTSSAVGNKDVFIQSQLQIGSTSSTSVSANTTRFKVSTQEGSGKLVEGCVPWRGIAERDAHPSKDMVEDEEEEDDRPLWCLGGAHGCCMQAICSCLDFSSCTATNMRETL